MSTLIDIGKKLNWNIPNKHTYEARIFYDPSNDNASCYLKIDDIPDEFRFAFDSVSKGNCHSNFVLYDGEYVQGISAELYIPERGQTRDWQINIYLDDGSMDRLFVPRSNWNNKGMQGNTQGVQFKDIAQREHYTVGGWK